MPQEKPYQYLDFRAEIKAISEKDGLGIIQGYASVFGNPDSYDDIVDPGCFDKSLKTRGLPMMLYQHDWKEPIGVWTQCTEDAKGLLIVGQVNMEVQRAREAYSLIRQGALRGLSIGFRTVESYYDDEKKRHLKEVDLMEVSAVTFPANEQALINGTRSDIPKTERQFEEFLRDAGFGRKQAKTIVSKGFKTFLKDQRDAGDYEDDVKAALEQLASNLKGASNNA